ncbi:SAP domain-containing protein [Cytobacillus pseudoceanisediminis]|uniref:SAP domain-containing protein n=1 Tax=Cytobacillus pseudoceanisediminis TaxID=3051614 RepID=UPI002162B1D8|nr:SAP domain-containing protein [Cytobacillus firmus]
MRPELRKDLDVQDFLSYYWLKEELQVFCRENGMSAAGSKMEITDKIAVFLQTGEIHKPAKKKKSPSKEVLSELNFDTVITENHRCSQTVRAFFKSVIPKFHFSTYIQNYFKDNAGKTYRDVVNAWYEEEERKKNPSYKKQIGSQFEYNQFTRDYFADPKNKGSNREEAIKAWNVLKKLPGSNKYRG